MNYWIETAYMPIFITHSLRKQAHRLFRFSCKGFQLSERSKHIMNHFHHSNNEDNTKENKGENNKHKAFIKMLLIHIGVLVLIILHIVLFKVL